jgi:hypothetical protein
LDIFFAAMAFFAGAGYLAAVAFLAAAFLAMILLAAALPLALLPAADSLGTSAAVVVPFGAVVIGWFSAAGVSAEGASCEERLFMFDFQ